MKKILIPRLHDKFLQLINQYTSQHNLQWKELAEEVGIPASHIAALRTKKRKLSMNYVFKFILKGVFRMDDIYDGKPESDREVEGWELCELCENIPLLKLINRARKRGCDIEGYAKGYLQAVEDSKKKADK